MSEEGYQDQESLSQGTTEYFLHSPSQFALANPPERLLNMKITMERGACLQTHGSCKVCIKTWPYSILIIPHFSEYQDQMSEEERSDRRADEIEENILTDGLIPCSFCCKMCKGVHGLEKHEKHCNAFKILNKS